MARYEYKYVRVELASVFQNRSKQAYHQIIDEHALEGWRLVTIFAPPPTGYDSASYFELIFERSET